MLNNKKTIKINPEIFKFGGKHKKEKTMKNNFKIPLVSPNILKNKLLKRVQDKQNKEVSNIKNTQIDNQHTHEKYNNEFNDSIQYLQVLSNEKKKKDEHMKREEFKNDLMKKTIRNKQHLTNHNLDINLELPDELKEDYYKKHIHKESNALMEHPPIKMSYNIDNNIPYGCLKGGIKKTYRSYKKEFSNTPHKLSYSSPSTSLSLNKMDNLTERELKLHKLKEKVFNQHKFIHNKRNLPPDVIDQTKTNTPPDPDPAEKIINDTGKTIDKSYVEPLQTMNTSGIMINNNNQHNTILNADRDITISKEIPTIKKKITTIRKYKLGKSKHNRTIGILLKDAVTKHKILEDYKEIKNKNINDIKKYLHKNNLLKYGSSAPNDVTRKIYENSVLAGEIININTDTIIHNMANNKTCD